MPVDLNRAQILSLWSIAINEGMSDTKFQLLPPNNYGEVQIVATLGLRPLAVWVLNPHGGYQKAEYKDENVPEAEV